MFTEKKLIDKWKPRWNWRRSRVKLRQGRYPRGTWSNIATKARRRGAKRASAVLCNTIEKINQDIGERKIEHSEEFKKWGRGSVVDNEEV